MRTLGSRRRGTSTLIATAAALTLAVSASPANAAPADAGTVTGGPASADGVVSATLTPVGATSSGAAAAAAPVISCSAYLGQIPHESGGDISWHVTWSCSQSARANGHLTLYLSNFPVANSYPSQYGVKGDMNVRYACSVSPAYWTYQGSAVITFSAPGYTSRTVQGYGPTKKWPCD
jgi:hypothetical protein